MRKDLKVRKTLMWYSETSLIIQKIQASLDTE